MRFSSFQTAQLDLSAWSEADLLALHKNMTKIADKKGVVVVTTDNTVITTYNFNSYNKKLAQQH